MSVYSDSSTKIGAHKPKTLSWLIASALRNVITLLSQEVVDTGARIASGWAIGVSDGETFTHMQLQAIADALGDTSEGLTGSEIHHLLLSSKIMDIDPPATKRHRLYNAFVACQNAMQDRRHILAFIRYAMKPEQYARSPERYEPMRANLNRALAFAGLAVEQSGKLDDRFRELGSHGTGRLFVDSSFGID